MKPRLINCLPSFGNAAGGEIVTIAGLDIDPAATVDFIPFPGLTAIPAAVVNFISFPNEIQHITVTTPPIPTLSGIPGDIDFLDRKVTIRITNPPFAEFDELELGWNARFLEDLPAFVEVGTVLFYPERLNRPFSSTVRAMFESYTENTHIWRQTYEWTSVGGAVDYKTLTPVPDDGTNTVPNGVPSTRNVQIVGGTPELVKPWFKSPYVTRGKIVRVVCESITAPAGWTVRFLDDSGIDAFQGNGVAVGPAPGLAAQFVPAVVDGYSCCGPVYVDDWMRFRVTTVGAVSGRVHIYLANE